MPYVASKKLPCTLPLQSIGNVVRNHHRAVKGPCALQGGAGESKMMHMFVFTWCYSMFLFHSTP